MATQTSEKVDISRILIHPVNGSASKARVTSLEAANNVLQSWADQAPSAAGEECEVEIIFEDGLRYVGHYPLKKQEKKVSLGRHVRRRLLAMAKTQCVKRNQAPANDSVVSPDDRDSMQCAQAVLEHYNI
ncbi:hypothetical protein [Noviherbaspirillum galbum]|uniref:Uncharacterized protein n=1 Tax=Noviherbaspirillum galbum TaxID=2709383 RepID=A0A6B3SYW4_9BURK|nr:hypothetical protein [Noviherbaspirillum galbum]NEX64092.1 hypothetical protein [Noviherbaspirillum galbum]